ncbi:MAG: TRAP transporter large permease subunit [Synergistetes bacterium]|nr:TRAP transporter large permease subunit [Synergistota bacterium]MDW8192441.1 TRAP transporter large permease subunit [Synergistota bacterium]
MFLISRKKNKTSVFIDLALVFMTLFSGIYLMVAWRQITLIGVGQRTPLEIVLAIFAVLVSIEGARRSIGMMLPVTAIAFLIYVFIGKWLPAVIGHRGYSLNRIATIIYYGTEGIFGTALDVSANVIIVFIIFGSLLSVTGAGQFFIDLAFSIAGRWRGEI